MQSSQDDAADINQQHGNTNNSANFQSLIIDNYTSSDTTHNNDKNLSFNNDEKYPPIINSLSPHSFFSQPIHANNHINVLLLSNSLLHQTTTSCTVKKNLFRNSPSHVDASFHRRQKRRRIFFHNQKPNVPISGSPTTYLAANTLRLALASLQLTEPSTEQLIAHIPNSVFNNLHGLRVPSERKYCGILLFLDVCGFTALTETYSHHAHKGINQLTRTLNVYFDKLVLEILDSDGDIYKFAGDAILALWQTSIDDCDENEDNLLLMCEKALNCAINLQAKCGEYQTDVDVVLRVKVALAYGPVSIIFVGNDEFKHYIMIGDVVREVTECEHECVPGDIIIAKSMYEKLSLSTKLSDKYDLVSNGSKGNMSVKYDKLIDTINVSNDVINDGDNKDIMNDDDDNISWRTSVDLMDDNDSRRNSSNSIQLQSPETFKTDELCNSITNELLKINDDTVQNQKFHFQHRRHSSSESMANLESLIKTFIIRCVLLKIEHNQTLEYLSELRRVTISFIHLDVCDDNQTDLCLKVQSVFLKIFQTTKMKGGVLTKALLFDKGWSFLCVFGLPGYKSDDDSANALKCAYQIHSDLKQHEDYAFVMKCSIGVATGLTYCGVVGHIERCEYTVIGRKVNMAARLMCNYPDVVSCDNETYYNSRLNLKHFQPLPDKQLKGMTNVGVIWKYGDYSEKSRRSTVSTSDTVTNQNMNEQEIVCYDGYHRHCYPLLGRRIELMIVASQMSLLDESASYKEKHRSLSAIIFEGDDGIGRTRLLQYLADTFENTNTSLSSNHYDHYTSKNSNANYTTVSNDNVTDPSSSSLNYCCSCCSTNTRITRVIHQRVCCEQRYSEYSLLRTILKDLLHFNDKTCYEKEHFLLKLFDVSKSGDSLLRKHLFLLNDVLDVRFNRQMDITTGTNDNDKTSSRNFMQTYEERVNELLLHILSKLIDSSSVNENYMKTHVSSTTNITSHLYHKKNSSSTLLPIDTVSKILFIIDDVHFADESSLKHLLTLGSHSHSLVIMSLKPLRSTDRTIKTLASIITDFRVYRRRLTSLENHYLTTLGCQILLVHRLPVKLIKLLSDRCNGIPGLCEQMLYDLLRKDKIYIVNETEREKIQEQENELINGDPQLLTISKQNGLLKNIFHHHHHHQSSSTTNSSDKKVAVRIIDINNKIDPLQRVCLVRNSETLDTDIQQDFQDYILCRIDRLSEGESLLAKIASVAGVTFSRNFLLALLDTNAKQSMNINECLVEMMQRSIIECAMKRKTANILYKQQQQQKQYQNSTDNSTLNGNHPMKCYCLNNLSGMAFMCKMMSFTHPTIRDVIYDTLTEKTKQILHEKAASYLEECNPLCRGCGGGDTPFLICHDLTQFLQHNQQSLFNIVTLIALKKIDNDITKQLRQRGTSEPEKNTSLTHVKLSLLHSLSTSYSNQDDTKINPRSVSDPLIPNSQNRCRSKSASDNKGTFSIKPSEMTAVEEQEKEKEIQIESPRTPILMPKVNTQSESKNDNLTLIRFASRSSSLDQDHMKITVHKSNPSLASPMSPSKELLHSTLPIFEYRKGVPETSPVTGSIGENNAKNRKISKKNDTKWITKRRKETSTQKLQVLVTILRFICCTLLPTSSLENIHDDKINNKDKQNKTDLVSSTILDREYINEDEINDNDKTNNNKMNGKCTTVENDKSSKWKNVRHAVCELAKKYRAENSVPNFDNEDLFYDIKQKLQTHFQLLEQQQQQATFSLFQQLYDESKTFLTFESYERYKLLTIHSYYRNQSNEVPLTKSGSKHRIIISSQNEMLSNDCDFNELLKYFQQTDFQWSDLRACECDDQLLTIYIHLVDHYLILNKIDEVLYYKIKICQLLLKCNCLQRVLIEIENGRKLANKHTYYHLNFDLLEATVLYRTRFIADAKKLLDNSLNSLNQLYNEIKEQKSTLNQLGEQEKLEKKIFSQIKSIDFSNTSPISSNRKQLNNYSKPSSMDQVANLDEKSRINVQPYRKRPSIIQLMAIQDSMYNIYSLEYLICQFFVLRYKIGKRVDNQTIIDESIQTILKYPYYKYPFSFSCSCTILLIDYYYEKHKYDICLNLINQFLNYWWLISQSREKLEFAKLTTISLIIELNRNNIERSIICGYFSKRVLTGFHENIFLVETIIQLTYSLLFKMRLSNIEIILNHLEYISDQTSNYYTKLWYYILVVDIAIEFGYELVPINLKFINLLSNYRKKLSEYDKQFLLFYVDCCLAQIYSRIKEFKLSVKHFNHALNMLSYIKLSLNDFAVQRALFKLAEVQLLNWWYQIKYKQNSDIILVTKDHFLYTYAKNLLPKESKLLLPRYYIYDAYFSRLVETYQQSLSRSLSTNEQQNTWKMSLRKGKYYAEKYSIKLDYEWIKQLDTKWSNKIVSVTTPTKTITKRSFGSFDINTSSLIEKPPLRKSVPHDDLLSESKSLDRKISRDDVEGIQNFIDWRLYNSNKERFFFYMLPVIV